VFMTYVCYVSLLQSLISLTSVNMLKSCHLKLASVLMSCLLVSCLLMSCLQVSTTFSFLFEVFVYLAVDTVQSLIAL